MTTRSKILEAYARLGSKRAVARELGLHHKTVSDHLKRERKLLDPIPGSSTSTLYRKPGPDGVPILEWVKTGKENVEQTIETIKEAFADYRGKGGICDNASGPPNSFLASDLLTLYPIVDLHFGMYSWKQETGADFDVDLATQLLTNTFGQLLLETPTAHAETAVILNVGDYFHSDNNRNVTERSGNPLDVDTRWERVLHKGIHLYLNIINMVLARHQTVIVKNIKGNHDPHGTFALREALAAWYHNEPRVKVEPVGDPIWHYRFGKVLLAAIHGDKAKAAELSGTVAARFAEDWGQSKFRYGYTGHWHKSMKIESGGMTVESLQTLAPKDAWNTEMGFCAGRSLEAITFDANRGLKRRNIVNVI
jgi:hypothetical protein